jgi:hypothetical protein
MVVVWKLIVHLASRSSKYSNIRLQLCVGWEECPFAMNRLYVWNYAFPLNLGLEVDVKGQLKKMMKCYKGFVNGLCGKYMLGVK